MTVRMKAGLAYHACYAISPRTAYLVQIQSPCIDHWDKTDLITVYNTIPPPSRSNFLGTYRLKSVVSTEF